jgi:hypothetical protein
MKKVTYYLFIPGGEFKICVFFNQEIIRWPDCSRIKKQHVIRACFNASESHPLLTISKSLFSIFLAIDFVLLRDAVQGVLHRPGWMPGQAAQRRNAL